MSDWLAGEWERIQWSLKDFVGDLIDRLNDMEKERDQALSDLHEADLRVTQLEAENDHLTEQLRAAEMGERY